MLVNLTGIAPLNDLLSFPVPANLAATSERFVGHHDCNDLLPGCVDITVGGFTLLDSAQPVTDMTRLFKRCLGAVCFDRILRDVE